MPPRSPRRVFSAALACAAVGLAAGPAAASASTWTVDDDKAQCPNAAFTSIQAAVDQAAPWDTIVVCQGLYLESSTPLTSANSPAQPGSQNGLTITKPLTIKGAGANKVTIRPAPSIGSTLAGTAPYLRDGGGNVITISRQSLGASDETENFVDISGVTVDSPNAYAEAGIAFLNTSGRISNSTIGPLKRAADAVELAAKPHGYGVIQTNSLLGAEAGSRRSLTIQNSLITGYQSGGVLFDDATGIDGAPANQVRSGLPMYGTITGTRIVGSGSNAIIPQNGVRYAAGARGAITGSEITGNYFSVDRRQSVGILLTDADTSATDPQNPAQPALAITGNVITSNGYGLFNADAANTAATPRLGAPAIATGNWWGCAGGPVAGSPSANAAASTCAGISGNDTAAAASVLLAPVLAAAPTALTVPGVTADAAPTVSFAQPLDTGEVRAGEDARPTIVAGDDFGVDQVKVTADGKEIANLTQKPYELSWIPARTLIGQTVTLKAAATDSSGQITSATITVKVVSPDAPVPPTPPVVVPAPTSDATAPPTLAGSGLVGQRLTCLPGTWSGATGFAYVWTRDGVAISGQTGATYTPTTADIASTVTCKVLASGAGGLSPQLAAAGQPVSFSSVLTGKTVTAQVGAALLKRTLFPKAKKQRLTIGTITCPRAAATTCTATVTGTLKAGKQTFTLSTKATVKRGAKAALTFRLSRKAHTALTHPGALSFKAVVSDDTGLKASATATSTATRS